MRVRVRFRYRADTGEVEFYQVEDLREGARDADHDARHDAVAGELARLVEHLSERLSDQGGERKIFRDSAVTNLVEFFDRFRQLSVRSSAELDALVDRAQQIVRGIEPQALRDNEALRQHVAGQLSRVQAAIDGMLVDQPRRRIIRAAPSRNGEGHATGD